MGSADEGEMRKVEMGRAMKRQRSFNLLTGCQAPLRETLYWLQAIDAAASEGGSKLFVAGDGRGVPTTRYGARPDAPPAFCVPAGFSGGSAPEDQRFLSILHEYTPQMLDILATSGWPEWISQPFGCNGVYALSVKLPREILEPAHSRRTAKLLGFAVTNAAASNAMHGPASNAAFRVVMENTSSNLPEG